ncbi:hemolysin family protein [Bacteroidota bacterium]
MLVWQIILLFVLLFLSGLFSGAEVALVSLSEIQLRKLLRRKKAGSEAIRKLKRNPQRMIITILIGNNIANISASVLATYIAGDLFGSKGAGIAIGVMTFLVLIFGEITPKSYSAAHSEKVSLLMAKPLWIMGRILSPLITAFEWMTDRALQLFGAKKGKKKLLTEEELKIAIEIGAEHKAIEHKEKRLLKNVLDFNDITAGEVMTERHRMFCLDANMKIRDALPIIAESPYSRTPLFLGSLDNITGVVLKQDVLEAINDNEQHLALRDISIKPFFVNEDVVIDELFKIFQEKHRHIAIVIGKKGHTAGLVTIEDLLEELVGEIIDETDITPNKLMRIDKKTTLADGETPPKYVNSFFNTNIPENYETLHDYLVDIYGKMPPRGQDVKIKKFTYHVEEIGEGNIERIKITKK